MGQGQSDVKNYSEEELLRQLAETDPDFRYDAYVDSNFTLQEVISIRQCFLDLREGFELNEGQAPYCGSVEGACADPPETITARKLRALPFLTSEEIEQMCIAEEAIPDGSAHQDPSLKIEEEDEGEALVEDVSVVPFSSGRPGSRKGITSINQPLPFDNSLISFKQFFNVMREKMQSDEDISIEFERKEQNVSCFLLPIFGN